MKRLAVLLTLLAFPASAEADVARAVDGNTIELNGTAYRLWGISAPEVEQSCDDGWDAGKVSAAYLATWLEGRKVSCEDKGKDLDGRLLGLCRGDGQDVGAAMVGAGMAWAFLRQSHDYVVQEAEAMASERGVHHHECMKAWEWRAKVR